MTAQTDLFDGLLEDVYTLTARRDLAPETILALRTATLSVHSFEAFSRDVFTAVVKLPNSSYLTAIDIQVSLPRLRGISSVRITDVDFNPMESPAIAVVEMGDIYDEVYSDILKNDIAYIAGTALNVRTSVPAYGYIIEYFQLPLVRREQYNSWIAQLAPEAIIYTAASIVLTTNGNEEKAKSYSTYVGTVLRTQLVSNFLTSAMR